MVILLASRYLTVVKMALSVTLASFVLDLNVIVGNTGFNPQTHAVVHLTTLP